MPPSTPMPAAISSYSSDNGAQIGVLFFAMFLLIFGFFVTCYKKR